MGRAQGGGAAISEGTAQSLAARIHRLVPIGSGAELAWSPEFLREGTAIHDVLRPSRLVFGVSSANAERILRTLHRSQLDSGVPLVVTDHATAEPVKVAANGFLATKISFIDAMADMCDVAGADVTLVSNQACDGADVVLLLTEWEEFGRLDPNDLGAVVARKRIVDGRNALDPGPWSGAGRSYRALGRPPAGSASRPLRRNAERAVSLAPNAAG